MKKPVLRPIFPVITDADWKRELIRSRAERNAVTEEIRRRLQAKSAVPGAMR